MYIVYVWFNFDILWIADQAHVVVYIIKQGAVLLYYNNKDDNNSNDCLQKEIWASIKYI